jgi:hypothetical protein
MATQGRLSRSGEPLLHCEIVLDQGQDDLVDAGVGAKAQGGPAARHSASRSAMSPITSLSKSGRRIGANIKIPLGVRNANALVLKQSPDLVRDLALHVVDAILGVLDPEPQLEFDRTLAKGHESGR